MLKLLRINPHSFAFTVLLGLFAALPALSVDMSAPTLSMLPLALGTSQTMAGLTLSLFMAGFALGQLGGGRLSDGRGRRPVLLTGLVCFTVTGAACSLATTGQALATFRLIQGFGAGACAVIAFAMVQDLFEGDAARAKRSYVTVILAGVPMLAPALGSVLIEFFGWRAVHAVLAAAGGALLVLTWLSVPESRSRAGAAAARMSRHRMPPLWEDFGFTRIAMANALSYAAIFAYIAGSPFVIMGEMGFSSRVFAGVFAATAAALAAGAWTSGRLTRLGAGASSLVNPGFFASAAATLTLAVVGMFGVVSGKILLPLLLTVLFSRGILAPNLQHLAIERQQERAGTASAAVGVSQLVAGTLASAVVAFLIPSLGLNAVAISMALLAVGAVAAWSLPGR